MSFHRMVTGLGTASIFFAVAGVLLEHPWYWWSFLALFSLFLILPLLEPPREVLVNRSLPDRAVMVGQSCCIKVEVEIRRGIGPVAVADVLPENCQLERGSNYFLGWKGLSPKKISYSYQVIFPGIGKYSFNRFRWSAWDGLGAHSGNSGEVSLPQELKVYPRRLLIKKMRNFSLQSRIPFPAGAKSPYGIPSFDLKEVRNYHYGDPYKLINWKATAKNIQRGSFFPMVNEMEKEGKKVVAIFWDDSELMHFGNTFQDSWEYGIEAVSGMVNYFLGEQVRVGFSTFGRSNISLPPTEGNRQHYLILKCLMSLQEQEESSPWHLKPLRNAVVQYGKYLRGQEPLCIVITRVYPSQVSCLEAGILEMFKYTGKNRGKYSVVLVNLAGYQLAAKNYWDSMAADLLTIRDQEYLHGLKNKVFWVEWDPAQHTFAKALGRTGG